MSDNPELYNYIRAVNQILNLINKLVNRIRGLMIREVINKKKNKLLFSSKKIKTNQNIFKLY